MVPRTIEADTLVSARAALEESGYCIVENVLTPAEVARARAALEHAADEDVRAGRAILEYGGANQRVANLVNRGDAFLELAEHPVALQIMEHVLGPGFLLSSLTANIAGPGGQPMMLHADQGGVPRPWRYPLVANVMWMLSDFTADNGATRIVPGSHRWDSFDESQPADTIAAEGPAGSIVCFEGRTIHGTGANVTRDERRHGVLAYHCVVWHRQQENFFLSLRPDVVAKLSPRLLALLGYTMHGNLPLGMVDGRPWRDHPALAADAAGGLALGEGLEQGPPEEYGRRGAAES